MADPILCDEIVSSLRERGDVEIDSDSEFKDAAGIAAHWTKNEVKSALSLVIQQGKVRRRRAQPESCTDSRTPPVTFKYVKG